MITNTIEEINAPKATFACSTCGLEYSRMEYLRRHQRKHTEDRPFKCDDCPKDFSRSDVLLRHRRRCHPEEIAAIEQAKGVAPKPSSPPVKPKARQTAQPYPLSSAGRKTNALTEPGLETQNSTSHSLSFLRGSQSESNVLTQPGSLFSQPSDSFDTIDSPFSQSNSSSGSGSGGTASLQTSPSLELVSEASPIPPPSPGTLTRLLNETSFPSPNVTIPFLADPTALGAVGALGYVFDNQLPWSYDQSPLPGVINDTFSPTWVDPVAVNSNNISPQPDFVRDFPVIDILAPEFHMLYSECRVRNLLRGEYTLKETDPYYLPPSMFVGCYQVPRWSMPPIARMSSLAARNFRDLFVHFGVVHEPTFRLANINGLLAFALCTAPKRNPSPEDRLEAVEPVTDGVVTEVRDVVRTEKTDMMFNIFNRDHKKMSPGDILAIIQTLLLYQSPALLTDHHADRPRAVAVLKRVIEVARVAGLFKPAATFVTSSIKLFPNEEEKNEKQWQKWINTEKFRRTAWLLYVFDTLVSLDPAVPSTISPMDVAHIPLPAPPCLWAAETAPEWSVRFSLYSQNAFAPTLSDALTCTFTSNPDVLPEKNLPLDALEIGPFARLAIVLTLLRGIIEFGEGRKGGGLIVQEWMIPTGRFDGVFLSDNGFKHAAFTKALDKWRRGWDFDRYCYNTTLGEVIFTEDATPYYWLGAVLLGMLGDTRDPESEGVNRLATADYQAMLAAARQFARAGEGI